MMRFPVHHRGSRRRAFTLVEMVIVVAILGILAAMAMPRFTSATNRYRARLAADRVMRDIGHAKARAISLGAQQTMTFASNASTYQIVGMQNPDADAKSYIVDLMSDPYRCGKITIDFAGTETLIFNGYGVPNSGGTVTVRAGGFQCVVTVAAGSGVASVGNVTVAY